MKPFHSPAHLRPDDLSRLAAHDLSKRRERVVRRHLATCSVCQNEWQAVQTLWRTAANANAALPPVPDALRGRIFAALPPAPVAPERRFSMPAVFVRPLLGASFGIAATAAMLGVGLVYGPALLFHAPRAVAFQDVENAMAGIKTATWSQTVAVTITSSSKAVPYHTNRKVENYMQASPPRLATHSLPSADKQGDAFEMGTNKQINTVFFGSYSLSFSGDKNALYYTKSTPRDLSGESERTPEDAVRRMVLFPRELVGTKPTEKSVVSSTNEEASVTTEQGTWSSGPDTLNGKPVVRLQNRVTRRYSVSKHRPRPTQEVTENTVWVAPDTYHIVRREMHFIPEGQGNVDIKTVCENYRYNVALPSGVFDIPVPPVGRPYLYHNYSVREVNNWKPLPADKAHIEATLQQAARLWNAKRASELFQNWDFGFNSTWAAMSGRTPQTPAQIAEEKRHWKARAKKGIPYQSWQLRDLTVAPQLTGGIYVREKENDPFPPTGRPVNYSATCDVLAVLKPGTKPVPCSMTATFHRVGNDFRITYLNMYDHEEGVGNGIVWRPKPSSKK